MDGWFALSKLAGFKINIPGGYSVGKMTYRFPVLLLGRFLILPRYIDFREYTRPGRKLYLVCLYLYSSIKLEGSPWLKLSIEKR